MTGLALPTATGARHRAGPLFAVAAVLAGGAALTQAVPSLAILAGLVCFLAGFAHGAGDESGDELAAFAPLQAVFYLVVGLAFAAIVLDWPLFGLAAFLALSAWHFARSECGAGRFARLAVAGLATGGSALLRPAATGEVFAAMLGQGVPQAFIAILATFGAAGAVATLIALWRRENGGLVALFALAASALFHPVLAVGAIFLAGHAWPIQQRLLASYGRAAFRRAVTVPTVLALLGTGALAGAVLAGWLALPVAAALALGLAMPHMLTERIER